MSEHPPRVLMIVGNPVTADTRVKKAAATLSKNGFEVFVLGISRNGHRYESRMGTVRVLRLPLGDRHRAQARETHEPSARFRRLEERQERLASELKRSRAELDVANSIFRADVQRIKELQRQRATAVLTKRRVASSALEAENKLVRIVRRLRARAERRIRLAPLALRLVRHRRRMRRRRSRLDSVHQDLRRTNQELRSAARGTRMAPAERYRGWQRSLPVLHDLDAAFGPEIERLRPDVIHAHDANMIGIAARSAARLRSQGHPTRVIYDAHEYVRGLSTHMGRSAWRSYVALERQYIPWVDAVITVSDDLARRLVADHRLTVPPTVVLNAPVVASSHSTVASVRERLGLAEDVALFVYSGRVHPSRDVDVLVDALPLLPDVHIALIANKPYAQELLSRAAARGHGDRFHVLPYVAAHEVVQHLRGATAGLRLVKHNPNHAVAMANKLFEYLQAGIPILSGDVGISADFIKEHDLGEVYEPGDAASFAAAARRLLRRQEALRQAMIANQPLLDEYCWARQEDRLLSVYERILEDAFDPPVHISEPAYITPVDLKENWETSPTAIQKRLLIAPRNDDGAAWETSRALRRQRHDFAVRVDTVASAESGIEGIDHTDVLITRAEWLDPSWQLNRLRELSETFTHVLFESGQSLAGGIFGSTFAVEAALLKAKGVQVGLLIHGTDLRPPRLISEDETDVLLDTEAADGGVEHGRVVHLLDELASFDGPIFVSSPRLVREVAGAQWLPLAVDTQLWRPQRLATSDRPLLGHLPHLPSLGGEQDGHAVLDACRQIVKDGAADFRRGLPGSIRSYMRGLDIYIDDIHAGDYTINAVRAMSMGIPVVGHVSARSRECLDQEVPVVEADADSLSSVIQRLIDDPLERAEIGSAGVEFAHRYHDGRATATALNGFLEAP